MMVASSPRSNPFPSFSLQTWKKRFAHTSVERLESLESMIPQGRIGSESQGELMASNTASSVNQLLDAALRYAALGWRVHPLHHPIFEGEVLRCSCRKTDFDNQGKHPKLTGWTERA